MNMTPEQEQFHQLRRLLVLKRYEQPPPGYFDGFSNQVILRLRSGERLHDAAPWESLAWEAPWVQRLLAFLQNRPAVAGGFGFAVCGLMLAGLLFAEAGSNPVSPFSPSIAAASAPFQAESPPGEPASPFATRVSFAPESGGQVAVPGQAHDSLFQQLKDIQRPPAVQLLDVVPPR